MKVKKLTQLKLTLEKIDEQAWWVIGVRVKNQIVQK